MNFFMLIESPRSIANFKSMITRKPRSCCFLFNTCRREVTSCKLEVEPPANSISASQSTSSDNRLLCSYGDINFDMGIYVLMGKLIKFGQFQSALSLYQNDVVALGIDPDLSILNSLAVFFCALGNLEYAMRHFDRLISMNFVPIKPACVAILRGLFAEEKFLEAFHYFIKICNAGVDLNCWSHEILVDGLCYKGYLNEVMEVFDVMRKRKGLEPTLHQYKSLFHGLCKRERIVEAESCAREIESHGFYVDKVMYNSLISGYCRHKKMKMAVRIYFRMLKTGCEPDTYTCNTLIHGFFKMDLFDKGWVLCKQMSDWGLQPNVVTNHIMISNYCRVGQVDAALMLLNSNASSNLSLNVHIYTVLIDALYKQNRLEDVHKLYKKMLVNGVAPDHKLSFILLKRCPKGKELQRALRFISMNFVSIKPACVSILRGLFAEEKFLEAFHYFIKFCNAGVDLNCWSHKVLIDGLCYKGYLNEVMEVFDVMRKGKGLEPTPHQYKLLFYGLGKRERIVEAESCAREMELQGFFVDKVMYNSLISGYCRHKKMKMAMRLYFRMLRTGCEPDIFTCNTLIHGFFKMGLFDKGWVLHKQMSEWGLQPDVVTNHIMISNYCKVGEVDAALMLLNSMASSNSAPDVRCYTVLIDAFYKQNRIVDVDELYKKMLANGVAPDHILSFVLLKRCPKGKELQLALMLLREFAKSGCGIDPLTLSKSATLNLSGDLNKEIELLLGEIVKSDPNLANVAFEIYISSLCKGGKFEEAYLCLSQLVSFGCRPLSFTYKTLIKYFYQVGLCKEVKAIIELMQDTGIVADMETYMLIVEGNCKLGNLDSALDILDQIEARGPKPSVAIYNAIISYLCKKKKIIDAENMFVRMLEANVDLDDDVFTTMMKGYLQNGKPGEACELFTLL